MEGLTGVDAHIGAKDLHKLCYDVVAPLWNKWSYGYDIPQEHTKLRATGKFAELTVSRDAIWTHFLKKRGGSKISQFDPSRELDIYITISDEDYEGGEFRRTTKRGEQFEDEVCHKRPKRKDRKDTSGGVSVRMTILYPSTISYYFDRCQSSSVIVHIQNGMIYRVPQAIILHVPSAPPLFNDNPTSVQAIQNDQSVLQRSAAACQVVQLQIQGYGSHLVIHRFVF